MVQCGVCVCAIGCSCARVVCQARWCGWSFGERASFFVASFPLFSLVSAWSIGCFEGVTPCSLGVGLPASKIVIGTIRGPVRGAPTVSAKCGDRQDKTGPFSLWARTILGISTWPRARTAPEVSPFFPALCFSFHFFVCSFLLSARAHHLLVVFITATVWVHAPAYRFCLPVNLGAAAGEPSALCRPART